MAVTVTQLATAANSVDNFTGSVQAPSAWSLTTGITNGGGNWMVALVAWRQQPQLAPVSMSVGDDAHNYWEPLGAPTGTSSASGVTRCSIWYAPAARPASLLAVAPSSAYLTVGVVVLELDGMTPWLSLSALNTKFVNSTTSLGAMTLAAPASQMIAFAVCGSDLIAATPTLTGSGWTRTSTPTANNGVDTTADLVLSGAYQLATGSVSATWSATGLAQDFSGVIAGLVVAGGTAPTAAQSNWPATITEVALGSGANTPADQLSWTPITARSMSLDITQGRQYQLAALQTGSGSIILDNPDGALIPPGSGGFAGIDSGTPIRTRMIWQGPPWPVQWHGTGSASQPGINTGKIFPVTPGVTYTAVAYLSMSLNDSSGIAFDLEFFNSGGTLLQFNAFVTGTAGTVRAVVSGTAPAGAVTAQIIAFFQGTPLAANIGSLAPAPPGPPGSNYLIIPSNVTWNTGGSATITVNNPFTYDVRGAPQTSPHNVVFSGFTQKWPQQWDVDTQRGIVHASLVDAWNYCNGNLQPILLDDILLDDPYAYWPMTDAPGSVQASNRAPGNNNPLVIQSTKYGNGGSTEAFGANSDALLGAQGTLIITASVRQQAQSGMWSQTLPSGVTTTPIYAQGYTASCTDPNFPDITPGQTIEFWFQIIPPFQNGTSESILVVRNTITAVVSLVVSSASTELILCQGAIPTVGSSFNVGQSGIDYRNMPGIQHFALSYNQTSWIVYIDGQVTNSGSWSPSIAGSYSVLSFNSDTIQPQQGLISGQLFGYFNAYTGYLAHVAVYDYRLAQGRIYSHYIAGLFASIEDSPTFRIERLLEAGGYLGRRVMMPDPGGFGTVLASCQDISGQAAADSVSNIVASTVPGTLTVTPAGELFYLARGSAYNQAVKWVLGDSPADAEYPYEGDGFLIDYDPTRTINDIQFTQLDNQDIVIPDISETDSVLQYGDNTYWQTGYLFNDLTQPIYAGAGLVDLANWIASTNIQPFLRPSTVTVDASNNPGNWPFVMGAAAGDMVTVTRRPPTSGETFTFVGRISQHQRTIVAGTGGSTASITVTIDPAPEASVLTLNDSVYGLLNGTNRLAW